MDTKIQSIPTLPIEMVGSKFCYQPLTCNATIPMLRFISCIFVLVLFMCSNFGSWLLLPIQTWIYLDFYVVHFSCRPLSLDYGN